MQFIKWVRMTVGYFYVYFPGYNIHERPPSSKVLKIYLWHLVRLNFTTDKMKVASICLIYVSQHLYHKISSYAIY